MVLIIIFIIILADMFSAKSKALTDQTVATQASANQQAQALGGYGQAGVTYMGAPQRPYQPDYFDLLNQFNTAFDFGITEITVSQAIYNYLMASLAHQARFIDRPTTPGTNMLTIITAGGYITVKPPGKRTITGDDFDRYMEDVDEHAP